MLSQTIGNPTPFPSETEHTNLNGIDLVKLLCAIMVFTIHVAPFRDGISSITDHINFALLECLCRISVPFYFACSGFFLFRKMSVHNLNVEKIKTYCFKLLRLFATWQILLIIGNTDQLWYLSGTVVAIIVLSLCFHFHLKFSLIGLLACLLYAIGLSGDSYSGLAAPLANISIVRVLCSAFVRFFGSTRNGLFMGFIFVFMGVSLSQHKLNMQPLPAAIGFTVSMIALLFEAILLEHYNIPIEYNMYVFLLPAVYFLFCFAYSIPLKDRSIYKHLRNIGMWFYFLHLAVSRIGYLSLEWLDQHINTGILNPVYVFSLPVTLLIAVCLDWLSGKDSFKWLNWLLA